MKDCLIKIAFVAVPVLLGGCARVVQETGMDESRFVETFFGSTFPTNRTHVEFVYKAGIRGFVAVARVSGPPEEIKKLLASRGVNDLRQGAEQDDVSKLLQLRITGLAKDKADILLPSGLAGTEYGWQSVASSNDVCEYYVATDYSHFIFIDLRQ